MRAKNLKYLRKKYKEKQTQLSAKVSIAQNTLSDYENGKLPIPDDVAQKLAYHYRISVFDFTYSDISENDMLFASEDGFLPAKQLTIHAIDALFPILPPPTFCEDKSFNMGYERILALQERIHTVQRIEFDEMVECLNLFTDSWQETHNESAVANCLCIILMMCTGHYCEKNEQEVSFHQSIIKGTTLNYLDAQKIVLRDAPNLDSLNKLARGRLEFFHDYEDAAIISLKRLKSSENPELRDLADYFLAIMYVVGFVDNEFDLETNQRIGYDLIGQLYRLENHFALKLFAPYLDHIGSSDI